MFVGNKFTLNLTKKNSSNEGLIMGIPVSPLLADGLNRRKNTFSLSPINFSTGIDMWKTF